MSLQGPITMEITVPPPGTPLDQIDEIGRTVVRGPIATSGPITAQDLYWAARDLEKDAKFREYAFEDLIPIAYGRLRQCQEYGYLRFLESKDKKTRISKQRSQAGKLGYEKSLKK
jgi:hypothetical protein